MAATSIDVRKGMPDPGLGAAEIASLLVEVRAPRGARGRQPWSGPKASPIEHYLEQVEDAYGAKPNV
jgi:hypothetical protein